MICTSCGTENERGRKFCVECGAKLGSRLPELRRREPGRRQVLRRVRHDPDRRRGRAPAPGRRRHGRRSPGRRRRRSPSGASCRSCSPTSSASRRFAEGRDAEETRELLSRYFELARDVIGRYGGTVEKFIGDAVMAVWGAPTAHEDDAERAVRAGLELVDAVRGLGPGIEARAGVLTGEAAVTIGRDEPGHGRRRPRQHRQPAPVGRAARDRPRRRGDPARGERGDRLRGGRRAVAQGQGEPGPGLAGAPRRGRGRRPRTGARRSRPRSSAATTSSGCSRTSSTRRAATGGPASCRSSGRPASARAGWPGSSSSTSTAWSRRSGGTTAAVPAYGEGITFWALGEMVRERVPASSRPTTRRRPGAGRARRSSECDPRRGRAALGRAGAARPARSASEVSGTPAGRLGSDELFAAWRTFFERIAAKRHGRHGLRGPPLGRHGPARLHRPPPRVVARACRSTS